MKKNSKILMNAPISKDSQYQKNPGWHSFQVKRRIQSINPFRNRTLPKYSNPFLFAHLAFVRFSSIGHIMVKDSLFSFCLLLWLCWIYFCRWEGILNQNDMNEWFLCIHVYFLGQLSSTSRPSAYCYFHNISSFFFCKKLKSCYIKGHDSQYVGIPFCQSYRWRSFWKYSNRYSQSHERWRRGSSS